MGRQTQLHVLAKDVNELIATMRDKEPLQVALRNGSSAHPEPLTFIPESMSGQILALWSKRFAPNLQRRFVEKAQPPYYRVDEQIDPVFELSLSSLTEWQGRPALTQGRIYAVFKDKQPEFEKSYDQIVRYIRQHWRKTPALWMGGYIGPSASDWFNRGGVLLPVYIPPVRKDWIERLAEQHPQLA